MNDEDGMNRLDFADVFDSEHFKESLLSAEDWAALFEKRTAASGKTDTASFSVVEKIGVDGSLFPRDRFWPDVNDWPNVNEDGVNGTDFADVFDSEH